MCNNNCLIPTPETLCTHHQQTFRNQDLSTKNIGDQVALNMARRKDNLQMTRYTNAARTESRNARTPREWKRPTTGCFQEIDTKRTDMRRCAILDSGASSHFLMMNALLLHKRKAANPITLTVAKGERVRRMHDGALDIPGLPPSARYTHVIPGIRHSLLSIV